jgi:hypothetical protein
MIGYGRYRSWLSALLVRRKKISGFNSRPSKQYLDAVEALRRLPLVERSRAYADATADDMKELASNQLGPVVRGKKSWRRILGERAKDGDELPGDDHVEVRHGKSTLYISHPYDLRYADLKKIVAKCEESGLEAHIDGKSWYFPGTSIRVTYKAANSN